MIKLHNSIFIKGYSRFVGLNIIKAINSNFVFLKKGSKIEIDEDIVIYIAGKANDFKNVYFSDVY